MDRNQVKQNSCLVQKSEGIYFCPNKNITYINPPDDLVCCLVNGDISADVFITTQKLINDTQLLLNDISNENIDTIIGVSRSGLLPATALATQLHLPLLIYDKYNRKILKNAGGNRTGDINKKILFKNVLLIDDTVASGQTFNEFYKTIDYKYKSKGVKFYYAAVYVSPIATHLVDFFAYRYELPHFLEWNFFNSLLYYNIGLDFDGILCQDVPNEYLNNDTMYERYIKTAPIKYCPRKFPTLFIASGRYNKYKDISFEWLVKNKIKVNKENLFFLDDNVKQTGEEIIKNKIEAINKNPQMQLFVESDINQARIIAKNVNKPILCPQACKVFNLDKKGIRAWKLVPKHKRS